MQPVPVTILTGFLGSGKTTLLNRLLRDAALADTAVIVNEFGEVGIDHLLVEQANEGVIELSDGCLCCTVRGELVDTLADLLDRTQTGRIAPFRRIVIETTGLADPAPVMQAVMGHPALAHALRLDGVVTTVDAVNGAATLTAHAEARKQVAVADRIVLTKTDLSADSGGIIRHVRDLNLGAPLLDAARGEAVAGALVDCGLYDPSGKIPDVARWLRDEAFAEGGGHHGQHDHGHGHEHGHHRHQDVTRHSASVRSFALTHDAPLPWSTVEMFLDLLRSSQGERLLRMKAIVCIAEDPERPVVLHGVQRLLHPPARLPVWPGGDRRTRIVLIVDGLDEEWVRGLFAAFTGTPQVDRPDRTALTDNPLAIPGVG